MPRCTGIMRRKIPKTYSSSFLLRRYDANVSLPGCDKNMPGCLIAMARLNRPALMVYGGTIRPGYSSLTGEPLDIVSAFKSYGGLILRGWG